jgi:MraZ protein
VGGSVKKCIFVGRNECLDRAAVFTIAIKNDNTKRVSRVFQGASALNLDAKGRMSVPAKHRDALIVQCEGRVTLTKHPHGCLLFFPRPVWESHREQIAAWPMSARAWQRIFLGNASDVEMDSAGRILVAPELRAAAGLSRDVMLLGMGSHFEIWDAAKLAESEAQAIANGMPDVLSDFSF